MTSGGARALLTGLVDYAGLFPPAGLGMSEAVAEYAGHRREPGGWMLGRFVVPAARLDELEAAAERLWTTERTPWQLSALVGPALEAHAEAVSDFNARHTVRARIDAVELTARSAAEAEAALVVLPVGLLTFVELPLGGDLDPLLVVLRERRARAKVRTGGVVPEVIPDPAAVAGFLEACARVGVAFKATAGLHHPVRAEHPLTYESGAPRATMHGFLNVFAAAAFAQSGLKADHLEAVLRDTDPAAFRLDDTGLHWRDRPIDCPALAAVRRDFALSFGSCSFREPVADLQALGFIT